jgi:antitoxin (DNA-binding transcriptional repressor) of toxin-antitoxin stability system
MQVLIVSVEEARERLAELIERVAAGDSVVIAEGGRSVARLAKPPMFPATSEEVAATEQSRLDLIREVVESHDRDGPWLSPDHPLRKLINEPRVVASTPLLTPEEESIRQDARLKAIREMVALRIADGYPPDAGSPLWQILEQGPHQK